MRVAVLTSGGDAPGMNAAMRAVARTGFARHWEVMGIEAGYRGLLEGRTPGGSLLPLSLPTRPGT